MAASPIRLGFEMQDVVAEYHLLREILLDTCEQHGFEMNRIAFRILNRAIDGAIAQAVSTYSAQKAFEITQRREEHLVFLVHDLRSPLSTLDAANELLQLDGLSAEEKRELHERNVRRMDRLICNVLEADSEGHSQLHTRTFRLHKLVQELLEDMRPVIELVNVKVDLVVPPDLEVRGDPHSLGLVWQNLLFNALKYAPGGRITCGARALPNGSLIECWVQDNGKGIPPEKLPDIFRKGETDSERSDGFGLGLSIVRKLVQAHGGEVRAESTPGQGATLIFTLPA